MHDQVMAEYGGADMRGRTAAGMRVCVAAAVAMGDRDRTVAGMRVDAQVVGAARVARVAAIPVAGM